MREEAAIYWNIWSYSWQNAFLRNGLDITTSEVITEKNMVSCSNMTKIQQQEWAVLYL